MKIETNKVYCMDAFELLKQLSDKSVDLVLTDPPYNVMTNQDIKIGKNKVTRNAKFDGEDFDIKRFIEIIAKKLKKSGCFYIFCSDEQLSFYIQEMKKVGLKKLNTLIWKKNNITPNVRKRSYNNQTEYIIFGCVEDGDKYFFNFTEQKRMINLLNFNSCVSFEYGRARHGKVGEWVGHPTQKPTKLFRCLLERSSEKGMLVLDTFVGSGTTAVTCKQLGRNFICCDNNADYVAIANKRLAQQSVTDFTSDSKNPTLAEPKEFNMGLEASASPTPKLFPTEITSPNPNIKRN